MSAPAPSHRNFGVNEKFPVPLVDVVIMSVTVTAPLHVDGRGTWMSPCALAAIGPTTPVPRCAVAAPDPLQRLLAGKPTSRGASVPLLQNVVMDAAGKNW